MWALPQNRFLCFKTSLQDLEYFSDKAVAAGFHQSPHSCPFISQWGGENISPADAVSLPRKRSFE